MLQDTPRRRGRYASALVLSPTRELAAQTAGVVRSCAATMAAAATTPPPATRHPPTHHPTSPHPKVRALLEHTHADAACERNLRSCVLHGGVSINRQLRDLERGVDVLVATPGRLLDVIEQNGVSLAETSVLVLDEADKVRGWAL